MRRLATTLVTAAFVVAACSSTEPTTRTVTFQGPLDQPGPAGFTAAAQIDAESAADGSVTGSVTIAGARVAAFTATPPENDGSDWQVTVELDLNGLAAHSTLTSDAVEAIAGDGPERLAVTDSLAAFLELTNEAATPLLGCGLAWAITLDADGNCDRQDDGDTVTLVDGDTTATLESQPANASETARFALPEGISVTELPGVFTGEGGIAAATSPAIVLIGDPQTVATATATTAAQDPSYVPPEGVTVTVTPSGGIQTTVAGTSACADPAGTVTTGPC